MKVLKFGGTSMASAETIEKVKNIVNSSARNRFIVVSAPGKRELGDVKITDMLYRCYEARKQSDDCEGLFEPIANRFRDIAKGLKLRKSPSFDLEGKLAEIVYNLNGGASRDYMASRGEYLSAYITAALLNRPFVDAADIVRFTDGGKLDEEKTFELCRAKLDKTTGAVCPGFYGSTESGAVKTFSRGGSDVTGAIIAGALGATVYENFTDVDGFMTGDPRIVSSPKTIDVITYRELRELSYMGADVLHSESIFPVRSRDIPIHIRNTFDPSGHGTMIVPSQWLLSGGVERDSLPVTGIAGKCDFFSVQVEKSMMNNQKGFARKLLSIVEDFDLSLEHMPSGIDTVSLVIDGSGVERTVVDSVLKRIKSELSPDRLEVIDGIALIAVVGHNMVGSKGVIAAACDALASADIGIKMIDQGSSGLNVIIAVSNADYEKAIRVLHARFFE